MGIGATPLYGGKKGKGLELYGDKALMADLKWLGGPHIKKVVRAAMREAAKLILAEIKRVANSVGKKYRTGNLANWVNRYFKVRAIRRTRRGIGVTIEAAPTARQRKAGLGKAPRYWIMVELGTRRTPQQSYIRAGFDNKQAEAERLIIKVLRSKIHWTKKAVAAGLGRGGAAQMEKWFKLTGREYT